MGKKLVDGMNNKKKKTGSKSHRPYPGQRHHTGPHNDSSRCEKK